MYIFFYIYICNSHFHFNNGDIVSSYIVAVRFLCFQKLMIDNKKCYFFGRNKQLCDFCIDHQSCSRVHAALVWHKHLSRPFIMDLGSSMLFVKTLIRSSCTKPWIVEIRLVYNMINFIQFLMI